jgi:hypothetical protein
MPHSNIYHELGAKYRRSRITFWVIVAVIVILVLLALAYYSKAIAMDGNYYQQVHTCVQTYKKINQLGVKPQHDVGQCAVNPTKII